MSFGSKFDADSVAQSDQNLIDQETLLSILEVLVRGHKLFLVAWKIHQNASTLEHCETWVLWESDAEASDRLSQDCTLYVVHK